MRIKSSYHIDQATFTQLYRVHCHVKFHLQRSMILSALLLVIGEVLERGVGMNFGWMNSVVFILVIISVLCNLVCDYWMPKTAFKHLVDMHQNEGIITITEDELIFGEGKQAVHRKWSQYTSCIEAEAGFLIYQRDMFTILLKESCGNQLEEVTTLLQNKVNHGKPIKRKK